MTISSRGETGGIGEMAIECEKREGGRMEGVRGGGGKAEMVAATEKIQTWFKRHYFFYI